MYHSDNSLIPGLILPALRHCWRRAVVFALVGAVLCAVGALCWGGLRMADSQARRDDRENYALSLKQYDTQLNALKVQIDALTVSIQKQQEHMDHSLLMALDPYDFYEGTVTLQLHTDYQILPGMTYQDPDPGEALRSAYTESLNSPQLLQAMAAAADADVRYMSELLTVKKTDGGLTVDVCFANADGARKLLDQIAAHLQMAQSAINTDVAEHTVTVTDLGIAHRLDPVLAANQQARGDKLAETVKTLTTIQKRQTELVKPTLELNDWGSVGKRVVLIVLVGCFSSGALYLAVTLWVYSGGSRLLCAAQLEQMDIPSLGVYTPEYTVPDLDARLPRDGTLLLTGSSPSSELEQLSRELSQTGRKVLCVTDVTANVQALRALQQCDHVVLAQRPFDTACAELAAQRKRIGDYGKPLLGCLILSD